MFNPDHITILFAADEKPWYMYHSDANEYLQTRLSQGFQYVLPHIAPLVPAEALAYSNPVRLASFMEMKREDKIEKKQNEFLVVKEFAKLEIWCGIDFKTMEAIQRRGQIPLIIVGLSSLEEVMGKCPNANAITLVNMRDVERAVRSEVSSH